MATSPDGQPRRTYTEELTELGLQVEMMALLVEGVLEAMVASLDAHGPVPEEGRFDADDEIDEIFASLTRRCYDLIALQAPVARDLRLIVSVLRLVGEYERVGDLALRVLSAMEKRALLVRTEPTLLEPLASAGVEAKAMMRQVLTAYQTRDLTALDVLDAGVAAVRDERIRFTTALLGLRGDDAVEAALTGSEAMRALDRIADHAVVMGARIKFLVTGDPVYLVTETK